MNRLFSWLLAFVLLAPAGCATPQVAPATASPNALTYLALGDSYTIGEGAAAPDRWPAQLVGQLAAQGVAVAAPAYIARTGWTTAELQAAIAKARPVSNYGLVSLPIGVNNQCRAQGVARYRPEFRALLHRAIGLAGGRPGRVVLSIPDWGLSPFGRRRAGDLAATSTEIDQFNAVARE